MEWEIDLEIDPIVCMCAILYVNSVELRQGTVIKFLSHNEQVTGVVYKNKDGSTSEARGNLTILCDGCYSMLRQSLSFGECKVRV